MHGTCPPEWVRTNYSDSSLPITMPIYSVPIILPIIYSYVEVVQLHCGTTRMWQFVTNVVMHINVTTFTLYLIFTTTILINFGLHDKE